MESSSVCLIYSRLYVSYAQYTSLLSQKKKWTKPLLFSREAKSMVALRIIVRRLPDYQQK